MNLKNYDELSAGFILYRQIQSNASFEYLILQSSKNPENWTPPKGHMKNQETEWETALRETEEESGLVLHQDFVCDDELKTLEAIYKVKRGQKKVVYFLGSVLPRAHIRLSHESLDMKWLSLVELRNFIKFRFDILLPLFEQAEEYLLKFYSVN